MGVPAERERITCCVIARDEEEHLPGALASVGFCDELVVVDSGSTDRTVEVARAAGAVVVEHPWRGFAAQRNVALDHATGDWVLELDADERITPELADEILAFLVAPPPAVDMCMLPMRELVGRHELVRSARYPFYRSRLFRRDVHRHDERRLVHEGIDSRMPVHAMRGDMIHLLADGPRELVADTWRYARLHAGNVPRPGGVRPYVVGILLRPIAKTAFRVVVEGGWRDGPAGVARILVAAAGDSVVWVRVAAGRGAPGGGRTSAGEGGGIAHEPVRAGPPRIVGVAATAPATAEAAAWLAHAAERTGADVVLVTPTPDHADGQVATHPVPRAGPLHLVRALDWIGQARPTDALLLARPALRHRLRLAPAPLRGTVGPFSLEDDPVAAVASVRGAPGQAPTRSRPS